MVAIQNYFYFEYNYYSFMFEYLLSYLSDARKSIRFLLQVFLRMDMHNVCEFHLSVHMTLIWNWKCDLHSLSYFNPFSSITAHIGLRESWHNLKIVEYGRSFFPELFQYERFECIYNNIAVFLICFNVDSGVFANHLDTSKSKEERDSWEEDTQSSIVLYRQ